MKSSLAAPIACVVAATFLLFSTPRPASCQVELKAEGSDHISISINGQQFSNFYIGPAYPKPFLAPLRTASGLIVTRQYPLESIDGESRDHQHHRGLFIGYGNISGINFWENEFSYATKFPNSTGPTKLGLLLLGHVDQVKSGRKSGTVAATFEWVGPDKAGMLEEHRTLTFYADKEVRTVDVDTKITAKTNVEWVDTKEGFFAIRIADSMTEKSAGMMTNSEGAQTEKNVWGKRADWVDYDGTVEGQKIGIVIFDHPDNFRHPTRWHSRAYGLFAANPFGLKDFDSKAAGGEGGYRMPAGQTLRFRYRVVIHPGDFPKKKIADLYSDYAKKNK